MVVLDNLMVASASDRTERISENRAVDRTRAILARTRSRLNTGRRLDRGRR